MLASLNLLNRFTDLPRKPAAASGKNDLGLDYDLDLISSILTRQGFEVESITVKGRGLENVVVGQILDASMHPAADRLRICKVDVGDSAPKQIVCGALNARTGLFVAVALPGAELPGGLTIIESSIRGVESRGMLCSREELGLTLISSDPEGIWELESPVSSGLSSEVLKSRIGQPVFRALELADVVLDLSVTPNRPDCLSHMGVAREIWAGLRLAKINSTWHGCSWLKTAVTSRTSEAPRKEADPSSTRFDSLLVEIASLKPNSEIGFSRIDSASLAEKKFSVQNDLGVKAFFMGFQNLIPKASPAWLRQILEGLDQNSINDVVDLSNLILLCLGQPSHAFDLDKLSESHNTGLWLRQAKAGEHFEALDGKSRNLHPEDCVVATRTETPNESRPEALLGVIGGENSKVDSNTKRIVIEWANPDPVKVRRTSRRIGKKTDSSFQFEKGLDRSGRLSAAALFAELICLMQPEAQYCGLCGDSDDAKIFSFAENHHRGSARDLTWQRSITWSQSDLGRFLGFSESGTPLIPWPKQLEILEWLGFSLFVSNDLSHRLTLAEASPLASVALEVPHWRWIDVDGPADIAEEIARMKGIDAVVPVPMESILEAKADDSHLHLFERTAVLMSHLGYTEVSSFHFMREDDLQRLGFDSMCSLGEPIRLLNPIIGDEPLLHTTLIPDLLRKVKRNVNRGTQRGQLFHICRTFQNLDLEGQPVLESIETQPPSPESLMSSSYSPSHRLDTSFEALAKNRPSETPRLAAVVFGNKEDRSWQEPQGRVWMIHDLMAHIEELAAQLGIQIRFRPLNSQDPFAQALHPKRALAVDGVLTSDRVTPIGWLGEFHPRALRAFEVDALAMGFELNLAQIHRLTQVEQRVLRPEYKPHRLPLLKRDYAVVVRADTPAASLTETVEDAFNEFLRLYSETESRKETQFARLIECKIFDVYSGEKVSAGFKSVAFEIIAEPLEKSFTDDTIASLSRIIVSKLEGQLGAVLRA